MLKDNNLFKFVYIYYSRLTIYYLILLTMNDELLDEDYLNESEEEYTVLDTSSEWNKEETIDDLKNQVIETIMFLRNDSDFMDELNELTFVYCSYRRKRGN